MQQLPAHYPPTAHSDDDAFGGILLQRLWRTAVSRRWLLLGIVAGTVGLAMVYTARQPREYESGTTILFPEPESGGALGGMGLAPFNLRGSSQVETEMLVLQSRTMAVVPAQREA